MSDRAVLSAQGLRKCYRQAVAIDGLDLRVTAGERVALVGPNGAGKTTTLMTCLGMVRQDAGTVEVLGQRSARGRRSALTRVGFAAGYLPLPPRLRVVEYLMLYARLYGIPDPLRRAEAGLDHFGVGQLGRRWGTDLSSGQRTIVGIVKATMHTPELLVLDEPTSSLDPDVAQRVRANLLQQCQRDGTALLVTSHNMTEVERLAQRIVFLAAGRVQADAPVETIIAQLGCRTLEEVYLHLQKSDSTASTTGEVVAG